MPKTKRGDKLKAKGDKRRKTDNLEVTLREDLAKSSGVVQPSAPRAPKQRARADSDDDGMRDGEAAKADAMGREQRKEERRRRRAELGGGPETWTAFETTPSVRAAWRARVILKPRPRGFGEIWLIAGAARRTRRRRRRGAA